MKKSNRQILINIMFNGSYLNSNIGHEFVNLFQTDSGKNYVYVMPEGKFGGYDVNTNSIELNSSYLENPDCEDLLNTILHESRHAFQAKCIDHPASVTVKENVIDVWKDNMDHYISPEFDFEAYENQEIEKDANYFADSVMKNGTNLIYA